ncbi:MAG TPA: choice-of-anchor J domain-containing protein, partial [Tenuifilaceae bacterium]|nr:choice-of-anchor J domain-containing protein [Tenuifilaceae bacterium]
MRKTLTLLTFLLIGIFAFAQQHQGSAIKKSAYKVEQKSHDVKFDAKDDLRAKEEKKIEEFQPYTFVPSRTNQKGKANLNEGFEDVTFPPEGWKVINGGDANTWIRSTVTPISGSASARIQWGSTAHNDWLITPPLAPAAGNSSISFWSKNQSAGLMELFNVKLSTTGNDESDFTITLASNVGPGTTAQQYTYDLTAYIGQVVYVAVQAISTDMYYLYVDDFEGPPIYVASYDFDLVVPNGASVAAGQSHDYTVTIKNTGVEDDTFTPAINGDGDWTYTLFETDGTTPLTGAVAVNADATYDFIVRVTVPATGVSMGDTDTENFTVTSAEGGKVVKNFSITTSALVPIIPPYLQGFDDVEFPPLGWTRTQLGTGGGNWTRTTPGANTTAGTMFHNYASGNHNSWIVSPPILLTAGYECALSFYERNAFVPADYGYSGVLISTGSGVAGST